VRRRSDIADSRIAEVHRLKRVGRLTFGGEFRGIGYVEFVDLMVDLIGRKAG
jgi:hypothetical protein